MSNEAREVAEFWAATFQPWMWNRYKHELTEKGKSSGLLRSTLEQAEQAIRDGWSVSALKSMISHAKNANDRAPLWKIVKTYRQSYVAQLTSLTNTTDELTHAELLDTNGVIKTSYQLADLSAYYQKRLGKRPYEERLKDLVEKEGVDLILYLIDEAFYAKIDIHSPNGLLLFKEQAVARKKQQLHLRRSLEYTMEILNEC